MTDYMDKYSKYLTNQSKVKSVFQSNHVDNDINMRVAESTGKILYSKEKKLEEQEAPKKKDEIGQIITDYEKTVKPVPTPTPRPNRIEDGAKKAAKNIKKVSKQDFMKSMFDAINRQPKYE